MVEEVKAENYATVPRTAEAVSLGLGITVVLLVGIFSYFDWAELNRSNQDIEQTRRIVAETDGILSGIKDAETGQRGYLLTGRLKYLEPYRNIVSMLPAHLQTLAGLVADRPKQQRERVASLKSLTEEKLTELKQTIELRRTQGLNAALSLVLSDGGKRLMDQIRRQCGSIAAAEYNRFRQNSDIARHRTNRTRLLSIGGSSVLFVLVVGATVVIGRATSRRQQLIQAIREKELETRRAKDFLYTTISSIGDGVIATDTNGKITFLNGVAQKLTEWTQQEAAGVQLDEVFRIVNEHSRDAVESPVAKALREGAAVGLANHTLLIGKNGTEVPIDDSAAPIWGEDKSIFGVVLVFRDVTARRKSEKALDKSRRETERVRDFLQTTLSSIGDGVIATDTEGNVTFMNAVAQELTAWTIQQAMGAPIDEVFSIVQEATLGKADNPVHTALREGAIAGLTNHTLLVAKNGRRIPIDDSAAPIRENDGRISGAVLVFRDISERRQAQHALEDSEQRFRAAFSHAPIGMVLTDLAGKMIQSNQAYCAITGYEPSELPAINFLSLTHPGELAENRDLFQRLIANEIPSYVLEKRIFRKSGETVWVRASATVFRSGDQGPTQVVGLVEDINARKQAERAVMARIRLAALRGGCRYLAHTAGRYARGPQTLRGSDGEASRRGFRSHLDLECRHEYSRASGERRPVHASGRGSCPGTRRFLQNRSGRAGTPAAFDEYRGNRSQSSSDQT